MDWLNANPNVEIVAEEKTSDYHSYSFKTKSGEKHINNINGYKKITYKILITN